MTGTAAQRRGLRGVTKLRRIFRQLDDEITEGVREALAEGAGRILADMQTLVPKDTGDLARLLDATVARDGLTARIGFVTPTAQAEGYYARFVEFGTKGHAGRNIPPQPARPFITPAFDLNADHIRAELRREIRQALERAATGPED